MAFTYSSQRSFVISDPYDSTTGRESYSSRPLHAQSNPPHVTPRGLMDKEFYYPYDDKLTDATRRFQGSNHGGYLKDLNEEAFIESYYSKKSLDTNADDLFDNFDERYEAKFPSKKDGTPTSGQANTKPVCRDLFRELDIDISKDNLGVLSKEASSVKHSKRAAQKPKEVHASKPEKYYSIRASSNINGGSRAVKEEDRSKYIRADNHHSHEFYSRNSVSNTNRSTNTSILKNESSRHHYIPRATHREDDSIENENDESRNRGIKNFMFAQNAAFSRIDSNYEAVQKTLSKIRRRDGRDVSGDWSILNDITNHHEKQIRRASVRESAEHRVTGDISSKRRAYEKESLENQRNYANHNDARKKINVSDMLASYHSKENNHPTVRSSYTGKVVERSRSKETGRIIQKGGYDKNSSYIREAQELATKRPSGIIERRNTKVDREPSTTYQALMKYYDLPKKVSKGGDASSGGRSTSMHRW